VNIEERNIVILDDDKSYFVLKKINYENINYYCLSEINKWENIKYLYESGNQLVEIEDDETFEKIVSLIMDTIDMDDFLEELKKKIVEKTGISSN